MATCQLSYQGIIRGDEDWRFFFIDILHDTRQWTTARWNRAFVM